MKIHTCIGGGKIGKLEKLVSGASVVSIVTHTHPDGDAIGCSIALCSFLREKYGKDAAVLLPDPAPEHMEFLLDASVPVSVKDPGRRIGKSDLVFLLDANGFSRTENLSEAMKASRAVKVLIDHHLNPSRKDFNLVFSTEEVSSASELLYWILKKMAGGTENLPELTRTALLTGMTTDTNNFANAVFPTTLKMASELIASGTDRDAILQAVYNSYRENRIRLMGYMQGSRMVITPEGVAYMILSRDIQKEYDYREGETEGLVNVPLAIGKVRMSILLTEYPGLFRVSIRSKKGTSAQNMAATYFHGGGHELAAGGRLYLGDDIPSYADAASYVEKAIKAFLG